MNVIELDMSRIELDGTGVKNFCWPVEIKEHFSMRDVAAAGLVQVGRRAVSKNVEVAGAFSVILHYFLLESITAFNNYLLVSRAKSGGLKINPSDYSFVVASFVKNRSPDIPKIDIPAWLRKGPPPLSTLRAPARFVRDLIVSNGIVRRRLIGPSFQKEIISTNVQPMAEAHAQAIAETVTFRRMNLWFGGLEKNGSTPPSVERAASVLAGEAVEVVEESFRAEDLNLPDFIAKYLHDMVRDSISLAHMRLRGLLEAPGSIPRRLWTGTGGFLWARLLRRAVRELGGHVTGHDHAMGDGHMKEFDKILTEYENCDRFVTSTPRQAAGLKKFLRPDLLIQPQPPEIVPLPPSARRFDFSSLQKKYALAGNAKKKSAKEKLQVMYVGTYYPGEHARYGGLLMPDVVAVDWQARLFGWLLRNGYGVIHKPHPDSIRRLSPAFEKSLNVRPNLEPFEQVLYSADVLVFDCHTSTTLGGAMISKMPIVYIDFELGEFDPIAREMIERRSRMIKGWFSEDNRAHVDWEELRKAIGEAFDLTHDSTFTDEYVGVSLNSN